MLGMFQLIDHCSRIVFYRNMAVTHDIHNHINPEKPDVPLNKNDAFQKVQKRRVQEKR